jgi:transposase-like protein
MTNTTEEQILKVDTKGRVKTPRERQEMLVAEFGRSGMSGVQFAKWAGIKYGTFATWVQKHRRQTGTKTGPEAAPTLGEAKPVVQWVEAVMAHGGEPMSGGSAQGRLLMHGPGGWRLELTEEVHVVWAAKLMRQLEGPRTC